jgi:hypothetical protein
MKILVIGGTHGMGKDVMEYFSPNSMNVSRTNGYDIRNGEKRKEIANLSVEYDAVLNHAYCGRMEQYSMLKEIYNCWSEIDHKGYIFHTGTYSTYSVNWNPKSNYTDMKLATDELAKKISKQCENNIHQFKCTNLRPGMLDTPRSRLKPHWEGNGIKGQDMAKIIEFLYNLPWEVCIPQIVIQAKHDPI